MKTSHKVTGASVGAIIVATVAFTSIHEGTDLVAKPDMIGTGHPVTYCHGQTDEFGKVKAGQHFMPAQCDALLAKSLPTYLTPLQACITADLPAKTEGALLDAAYNAGAAAVCKSPMVAKMNAGDIQGGCEAFSSWYIRASGRVVQGLINRRNDEKKLCLAGLAEPKPAPAKRAPWWAQILSKLKELKLWH